MALILKRNRKASVMRILVTDSIAQEDIDLLRTHLIATPHLGASTQEAQVQVAIDVAEQIVSFLQDSVLYAA